MSPPSPSFTEIPIIDLSLANSPHTRPALLRRLHHALTSVGFLYITNHEVPETVITNLVQALPVLFSLPDDVKEQISLHNSPHFLGYSSVGAETTAGKKDHREQVEYATELPDRWVEELPLYERLKGPNQWPSNYPELRPIITNYITELTSLGDRFLRLVAESLSLPQETFFPFLSEQHRLKLVRYPGFQSLGLPSATTTTTRQGVGPHKDSSGWWTFLLQASPEEKRGLQVLNKDGQWIDVPPIVGTFVVNIGQAFEVVTNGFCKATTHRVELNSPNDRYSVPFFQGVRGSLTKKEAVETLKAHFREIGRESEQGLKVDSPFLQGKYDTWGEAQLRTKIRSHRDVGRLFYEDVYDKYVNDD
ncbi:hyoscyamine 6-dioxygenase, putative [Paecilomyces variotii No. 5]|uniref:Hyoscyamine 6-dioxygenase, putative n=1 Tax=Byssochlamys spectabilis (strain No. 5 / NBRC 109023) TaxID=1356009 RepID=V5FVX4_BYSSN|nr:hyoscyamine 6-dioxygenase, putative [Paecilomyces variotii No. 5]